MAAPPRQACKRRTGQDSAPVGGAAESLTYCADAAGARRAWAVAHETRRRASRGGAASRRARRAATEGQCACARRHARTHSNAPQPRATHAASHTRPRPPHAHREPPRTTLRPCAPAAALAPCPPRAPPALHGHASPALAPCPPHGLPALHGQCTCIQMHAAHKLSSLQQRTAVFPVSVQALRDKFPLL